MAEELVAFQEGLICGDS